MKNNHAKVRPNSSRSARLTQVSLRWLSCGGIESGSGLAGSSEDDRRSEDRSCSLLCLRARSPPAARNMVEV